MRRISDNFFAYLRGLCYIIIFFFNKNIIIGKGLRIFRNSSLRANRGTKLIIDENVKVDRNTLISLLKKSKLHLGKNVGIGANSMIVCHKEISIGDNTIMGPGVYLYDHDHVFSLDGIKAKEYNCEEINIGKNCWIGAGCIILKGTRVGDNCVIGAGTLLNGNYPPNSMVVNKRETIIKKIK